MKEQHQNFRTRA